GSWSASPAAGHSRCTGRTDRPWPGGEMNRNGILHRAGQWSLAVWMAMVMMVASFTPAARAQTGAEGTGVSSGVPDDPPADTDRWWGALAAGACGGEFLLIRTAPPVG